MVVVSLAVVVSLVVVIALAVVMPPVLETLLVVVVSHNGWRIRYLCIFGQLPTKYSFGPKLAQTRHTQTNKDPIANPTARQDAEPTED